VDYTGTPEVITAFQTSETVNKHRRRREVNALDVVTIVALQPYVHVDGFQRN